GGPLPPYRHTTNGCEQTTHEEVHHQQRECHEHRLLLCLRNGRDPQSDTKRTDEIDGRSEEYQYEAAEHRYVKHEPRYHKPYREVDHREGPERYQLGGDEGRPVDRGHIELVERSGFLFPDYVHRRHQRADHRHQHHEDSRNHVLTIVQLGVVPAAPAQLHHWMASRGRPTISDAHVRNDRRTHLRTELSGIVDQDRIGVRLHHGGCGAVLGVEHELQRCTMIPHDSPLEPLRNNDDQIDSSVQHRLVTLGH